MYMILHSLQNCSLIFPFLNLHFELWLGSLSTILISRTSATEYVMLIRRWHWHLRLGSRSNWLFVNLVMHSGGRCSVSAWMASDTYEYDIMLVLWSYLVCASHHKPKHTPLCVRRFCFLFQVCIDLKFKNAHWPRKYKNESELSCWLIACYSGLVQ